ncbi:diguanylate cyclase [Shewanella eurypsychrophilus]|uniref:diguanylate cyclase n=1 Tax=Shewanella eurypsychrophilus TaxID=2593656 RepID=A0ABX6VAG0_9GAMM|nr:MULTISPECIES: diguanylate cyclase [Shewanella]QFU23591.1 diguanylate cyclase [Shewanella sp. YLB-09]QPG58815.1 diguanylate cyclase [Shewanella eurypsychrophilus]
MADQATILLVDDTRTNIQLLAGCLKSQYRLKIAMGGQRCIELAQNPPLPDLILLDVIMPEMDGYQVCRQLKANPITKHIPIIFVTGRDSDEDEEFGLQLGAVDYITKPIRPAIVTARVSTQIQLKHQSDELRNMALHDQLTQLYNRHFLIESANNKLAHVERHGNELSVMMIDIDYFKHVNDEYGHHAGDEVLKGIAEVFKQNSRKEDVVARFGGEEFVILLEHCPLDFAMEKAELLRAKIEALKPSGITITASFGVAQLMEHELTFVDLLSRADAAVYKAKDQGRNQVVAAEVDVIGLELEKKIV